MTNEPMSKHAKEFLASARRVVVKEDPYVYLRDFLAWAQIRRPLISNAPVDDETINYVAQGIELFLDGKKPWTKRRGNKPKPDLMWEAYSLAYFTGRNDPYKHLRKKRHTDEGGLYEAIGKKFNISAKAVETHERNAKNLCKTLEGQIEFARWLGRYKGASVSFVKCHTDEETKANKVALAVHLKGDAND